MTFYLIIISSSAHFCIENMVLYIVTVVRAIEINLAKSDQMTISFVHPYSILLQYLQLFTQMT